MKRILKILTVLVILLVFSGDARANLDGSETGLRELGTAYEINPDDQGILWITDFGSPGTNLGEIWGLYPVEEPYFEVYPVGGHPSDARHDGTHLWWADAQSNVLGRTSTVDLLSVHWEVPGAAGFYGTALDNQGRFWTIGNGTSILYRLDPAELATDPDQLCTFLLPVKGKGTYLVTNDSDLWIGDWVNRRILRLNIEDNTLNYWSLPVDSSPLGMALDETGNLWYADDGNNVIARLNPTNNVLTSYQLPAGNAPMMVTIHRGIIWYTEQGLASLGRLDPQHSSSSNTTDYVNGGSLVPICNPINSIPSEDPLTVTNEDIYWENNIYSTVVNEIGWQIYQLPGGSRPWGIADTDSIWFVDADRHKLARIATSPALIQVDKTANTVSVPETGGNVTFTFRVSNTSTQATVTITRLEDSVYGTLSGDADCMVGTTLAAGASCEFSMIERVVGDYGGPNHFNTFTVYAQEGSQSEISHSDSASVSFTSVAPTISVTKSASPGAVPETGSDVTFTYVVTNEGLESVTLSTLWDDKFGTLGDADCPVGLTLTSGASCTITDIRWLDSTNSRYDHINTFTATAFDDDGMYASATDNATVDFIDVLPSISVTNTPNVSSILETGGNATFTYVITNDGLVPVTIMDLSDTWFGTLAGDDDCRLKTILTSGGSCSFTNTYTIPEGDVPGNHINSFTAVAIDSDGNHASITSDAEVTYTDVLPEISAKKDANPTTLPEIGANVDFTFRVTNHALEAVTITSLSDSIFGDLAGASDCQVGTNLEHNEWCEFTITHRLSGSPDSPHENTFTAVVQDDELNIDTAEASATVSFTEYLLAINVLKTANPTRVLETGGDVTFTFVVRNDSTNDSVTITALTDSLYGALDGGDGCEVGTILDPGINCNFSITRWVDGDTSGPAHENIFTAEAEVVGSAQSLSDSDSAEVGFDNVIPQIQVTKTANPTSVPETGGDVIFTFVVNNLTTHEPVTIHTLNDSFFGSLMGDDDCQINTELGVGESCEFSLTEWLTGSSSGPGLYSEFTATVKDNDGSTASDNDDAIVEFTAVEEGNYVYLPLVIR